MYRFIDALHHATSRGARAPVIRVRTSPLGTARSCRLTRTDDESGVYMTFLALFLVVLVAMVGLALDAGTIYTTRLSLQASADAGAVSGLARHAMSFDNETNGAMAAAAIAEAAGEAAARQVALTNLSLKHVVDTDLPLDQLISNNRIVAETEFHDQANSTPTELRVRISVAPRLYLLQRLPGFKHYAMITVNATARLSPARVSLILDSSASMACPVSGNCNCLTTTPMSCNAGASRMTKLKTASRQFLRRFNTLKDSVSLIGFGNAASVLVPMNAVGFDADWMRDRISTQLAPYGATNIPDALIRAYRDARNVGLQGELNVVALTDGSITATRVILRDPRVDDGSLPDVCDTEGRCNDPHHHPATDYDITLTSPYQNERHNPFGPSMSSNTVSKHDYVQVAQVMQFADPANPTAPPAEVVYPYHLVLSPGYRNNSHASYWQATVPYVGEEFFRTLYSLPTPSKPSESYKILFETPNYFMPDEACFAISPPSKAGSTAVYRGPYWNGTTYDWDMFDEVDPHGNRSGFIVEYMNHALAYADYIRQNGGSVSVIATGERAPNPMSTTTAWNQGRFIPDVYQHRDNASVKYFYLWRLAFDRCYGNASFWMQTIWPTLPTYAQSKFKDFVGFPSFQTMRTQRRRHGFVLESPDPNDLESMFAQTLLRLRMGLIR